MGICIGLFVILAIVCAFSFICATSVERTVSFEIARPKVVKTMKYSAHVDSISSAEVLLFVNEIDSLRREVKLMESQHENALNDLRQETNNIINKLNGWLSFWIAVSALLCIILPIICQYFIINNFEKEYKQAFERHDKDIENKIEEKKAEIEELKDNFTKDKDNAIKDINNLISEPKLQTLLAQYRIGNDCNLIHSDTSIFNAFQWNIAINNLENIIVGILSEANTALDMSKRYELQKCLIQASGFLQEINRHISKKRKRSMDDTIIRILFNQLENGTYPSLPKLREQIANLLRELRLLIS